MKLQKSALTVICFAVFFALHLSSVPTVVAGDDMACANYANTAVAQQKDNNDRGCGYTGPAWNRRAFPARRRTNSEIPRRDSDAVARPRPRRR